MHTLAVAGYAERVVRPASPLSREATPFRLVGLLNMLRVYAKDFVVLMQTLDRVRKNMSQFLDETLNAAGDDARQEAREQACKTVWGVLAPMLNEAESACSRMELKDPAMLIRRIRGECRGNVYSIPELQGRLRSLTDIVEAQLNDRVLMYVPAEMAKYFADKPPPFGEKVQDKFPGITGDIVDAGWCLGVGRASAAVYHLMLVMEFGIRRLAKRLKLPKRLEQRPWGEILGAARTAINDMPYGTTKERNRRDKYNEVVAHLGGVKDAWRNPTMHGRRRYTPEEAEAIYGSVRTFMRHLAEKVF